MAVSTKAQRLGGVLVAFTLHGRFPDDIEDLPSVSETDPNPAIEALGKAKTELEVEIRTINEEIKDDVSSWVQNAKALQEDILRSKVIANDIVRQSEAPDASGQASQDAESNVEFLQQEMQYNNQLREALTSFQYANQLLSEVEQASVEWRLLDSLRLLEKSWAALDQVGVSKATRVVKLLESRAFELKSAVHDVVDQIWKTLIEVNMDEGRVVILDEHQDKNLSLADMVVGLKAYREVDERVEQFWRNLDASVVAPRMDAKRAPLPAIKVESDTLALAGSAENSVHALLSDLQRALVFVAKKLPQDLLQPLCGFMMPDVIPRLIQGWLNPAIPSGLRDMDQFQTLIFRTKAFCEALEGASYTGFEELKHWADKAPMKWLEKCKETALDTIRISLAGGVGAPKRVEKIEKQMVSISEGKELATTGAGAAAESNDWGADWGDAWDDDHDEETVEEAAEAATNGGVKEAAGDDDGADAWGWDDDENHDAAQEDAAEEKKPEETTDEDDGADAWGWGDDGAEQEPEPEPEPEHKKSKQDKTPIATSKAKRKPKQVQNEETRELVFRETYSITSMPEPVLELIFSILEDGATLTNNVDEHSLVAATAPGLFGLPTFALALFRAISPSYYSMDVGGNMFLYNDAMYLAEKLSDFTTKWKKREDLSTRAQNMLRLENDVKSLENFAIRSYSNEMNVQKTVLQDLIGSSQNFMHQDEREAAIEAGTARVMTVAATWEPILRRSVWSQAIGALADSLASRIISDVLELSSIGQEEAYSIAKLITSVTELDALFLPSKLSGGTVAPSEDEVPTTVQYAPNWLRLKYLSEVLQSNLNEVKFLWCESELSLYFTVDEVIDLIQASFEDNPRTRDTIREIRAKPARS